MTPRAIALKLLPYIGITSLEPADNSASLLQRGLDPFDVDFCAMCITGALQEIFDDGPSFISERPMGAVLRPPATISFTATQYGTAISSVTGFQTWMTGCTIMVSGDSLHNRLVSATSLLRPHMGSSGAISGTVYADCVPLPSNVRNVLEPVELPNNARLHMAGSAEEFRRWNGCSTAPVQSHPYAPNSYSLANKSVGEPVVAFVDSAFDETLTYLPLFLRFNPMTAQPLPVSFRVKLKPPVITSANIDNGDHTTDPNTVIPQDWNESVLVPFALQRFTSHPSFAGSRDQLEEIGRQYTRARKILQDMKPGISRTRAIYAQG